MIQSIYLQNIYYELNIGTIFVVQEGLMFDYQINLIAKFSDRYNISCRILSCKLIADILVFTKKNLIQLFIKMTI